MSIEVCCNPMGLRQQRVHLVVVAAVAQRRGDLPPVHVHEGVQKTCAASSTSPKRRR